MTWLSPGTFLKIAGVVALLVASHWVRSAFDTPEVRTRTDTVRVDRELVKRDTVTKIVPRTVRVYDTVETVDTAFVPVPDDYRLMGTISPSPIDIQGREVTLTYWNPDQSRFVQNVYEVDRPSWAIDLRLGAVAAQGFAVGTSTIGVSHRTPVGWLRLGGGYGASVTGDTQTGWVGTITLRKSVLQW